MMARSLLMVATALGSQDILDHHVGGKKGLPHLPVPNEPFTSLEHINVNSGRKWSRRVDAFYFDVLRCGRDPRALAALVKTNKHREDKEKPLVANLTWANVGHQQFHLPYGDLMEDALEAWASVGHGHTIVGHHAQAIRGTLVLAWPASKVAGLFERLRDWGSHVDVETGAFRGPHGARFAVEPVDDQHAHRAIGPVKTASRLGAGALPGGESEGVGLRAIRFDVPVGTAVGLCRFYETIFTARTRLLHSETTCVVKIGHNQELEFEESEEVPPYDGHHVCLYVNGQSFIAIYDALFIRGLIYSNPRYPQFNTNSIYDALQIHEFRLKDLVDLRDPRYPTRLFELEHEIRSLNHPAFALRTHLPEYQHEDPGLQPPKSNLIEL